MTLALILGICSLLVSPLSTSAGARAWVIFRAAPSRSDSPQAEAQPVPTPVQPVAQKAEPAPDRTRLEDLRPPTAATPPAVPASHARTKPVAAPKTAPRKHRTKKKPVAPPADGPRKVIVNNGGVCDPAVQLSPGVSPENASRQRQSTDLLLSTSEQNLNMAAGHQLNTSEQDTVSQVREYMKQAKTATAAGDLQRAHNLAFKAKLLSDELSKP